MLTAIQYHNLTNQSQYDSKGAVDKPKTMVMRQEAQKIYNNVFNLPDPKDLTEQKPQHLIDLENLLVAKYEKKAD